MKIQAAFLLLSLLIPTLAIADSDPPPITVGQPAPEFPKGTVDQDAKPVSLGEYKGRKSVVLYFYPMDDTPGCTTEAKGFTASRERYDALDAVVLGVSTDDVESHKEFVDEHGLAVRLVADPEKKIVERWDVKSFFGWAQRKTFLIDKEGIVRKIYPDVDPDKHAEEVLGALRLLQAPAEPK